MYRTMRKPRDPAAAYALTEKKRNKSIKRHDDLVGDYSECCMGNPRKASKIKSEMDSLYRIVNECEDDMVYLNEKYGVGDDEWCKIHKREDNV